MSKTHERGRGRPSADEVREIDDRILRAALVTFDRAGFDAAKMETIAEEAGVTKAALYRRFRNKGEVLVGVIDQLTRRFTRSPVELDRNDDPLECLRALMVTYRARAREPELLILQRLVIAQLSHQPELGASIRQLHASYVAPVDELIRAAFQRYAVKDRSVEKIRELLFNLLVSDITTLALFDFEVDGEAFSFEEKWALVLAGPLNFGQAT